MHKYLSLTHRDYLTHAPKLANVNACLLAKHCHRREAVMFVKNGK